MELSGESLRFWQRYLAGTADPDRAAQCFHEVFRIGDCETSAERGSRLVLDGSKTATSSLLWEYEAARRSPPRVGALSILENGRSEPVCVVESTEVLVQALSDVDARFAWDYGEWDRTLDTWRARCFEYYAGRCRALGRAPAYDMPLVCERFRVVFPGGAAPGG